MRVTRNHLNHGEPLIQVDKIVDIIIFISKSWLNVRDSYLSYFFFFHVIKLLIFFNLTTMYLSGDMRTFILVFVSCTQPTVSLPCFLLLLGMMGKENKLFKPPIYVLQVRAKLLKVKRRFFKRFLLGEK